jgi:hypothetical protein
VNPFQATSVYALFANAVVVVVKTARTHAMTVISHRLGNSRWRSASTCLTNKVYYVPRTNGSLTIIDGATNTWPSTLAGNRGQLHGDRRSIRSATQKKTIRSTSPDAAGGV